MSLKYSHNHINMCWPALTCCSSAGVVQLWGTRNDNNALAYYLSQKRILNANLQNALYQRDQLVRATSSQLAHECFAVH